MTTTAQRPESAGSGDHPVTLESGDRLTRAEFHRRYSLRPDIKKAELVQGVVYVASPVRMKEHGEPHLTLGALLWNVAARIPGLSVGDNATVLLSDESTVQPDLLAYWDPPRGSGARLTEEGYIEGPPLLVIEIAASSASYDLHDKLEAYRRAGVAEYVVWRVEDNAVDWLRLRNGAYVPLVPDDHGVLTSEVLPGLRLDTVALFAGDRARLLAAIGIAIEERP